MTRTVEEIARVTARLDEHLEKIEAGEIEPGCMARPSPEIASLGHAAAARDAARSALNEADTAVESCVLEARRVGHSWSEIALALGVRRQTAHKRYRHLERAVPAHGR